MVVDVVLVVVGSFDVEVDGLVTVVDDVTVVVVVVVTVVSEVVVVLIGNVVSEVVEDTTALVVVCAALGGNGSLAQEVKRNSVRHTHRNSNTYILPYPFITTRPLMGITGSV